MVSPRRPAERDAIISGIGQSQIGRRLGRSGLDLTIEAGLRAVADAGLNVDDIDGISTYPSNSSSFGGATGAELHDALRVNLRWRDGGPETSGQLGAVHKAALAVSAGLARHVLVFRTVVEGSGPTGATGSIPAFMRFLVPYGAGSAANWVAMYARRHMHEHATTREHLGAIAINARTNAALNPSAIYTEPMTMTDYLGSRMISDPLCLFDCDVPCDASTAVIVSHRHHGPDSPNPVVNIAAMGTALGQRPSWDQYPDLTTMPMSDSARSMWNRTSLGPADVDAAQLYDGFSWLAIAWIEALGFCERGDAGPFIAQTQQINIAGALPLNTAGGQLSGGRLHGFGLLHEAVVQLRHDAGPRQVPNDPEVAVVAAGGGPEVGCLLLTRGLL